ncbi:MAG: PTS sugar transporter subunit IIA [Deltaproteobacteria bacterium]|nr:PTS sugar transporter subunit IIA [Deltaproteobacteria bacterium]
MDLTVRDLTQLFQVSEKTIYCWIKEKGLAASKIQDQYRVNRAILLEWIRARGLTAPLGLLKDEKHTPVDLPLTAAISEEAIHYEIPGKTKEEVFSAMVQRIPFPPSLETQELVQLLLLRESLASTGVGEGIAIPHVRDPIVLPITASSISICFLKHPLDFQAIDRKPVHTFFLLLSTTIRDHLHLLSRISYLLHDPALLKMLAQRAKKEDLIEKIRFLEKGLAHKLLLGTENI